MLLEFIMNLVSQALLGMCLLLNRAIMKSFVPPSLSYYLVTSSLFFLSSCGIYGSCYTYGCHQLLEINYYSFIFISGIVIFPGLSFPKHALPMLALLARKCLKSEQHSLTSFVSSKEKWHPGRIQDGCLTDMLGETGSENATEKRNRQQQEMRTGRNAEDIFSRQNKKVIQFDGKGKIITYNFKNKDDNEFGFMAHYLI